MIFDYEKEDYKKGLLAIWDEMNPKQQGVLLHLYNSLNHSAISEDISRAAGYTDHRGFNLLCRNAGPRFMMAIGKSLEPRPYKKNPGYWRIWVSGDEKTPDGKWLLVMRSGLVEAMQELNLVAPDVAEDSPLSQTINCEEIIAQMDFTRDVRKAPDTLRQGRFRSGWLDATERGKRYATHTLRELTWSNLGYRLGQKYGTALPANIDAVYAAFATHYGSPPTEAAQSQIMPDEMEPSPSYREGSVRKIVVNAYERNRKARNKCIDHFGRQCFICKFDFEQHYGTLAEGFIHVHHLRRVSDIGAEYEVDPIADLRPVCPNCHAVIHLTYPPQTIEQMQALLQGNQQGSP